MEPTCPPIYNEWEMVEHKDIYIDNHLHQLINNLVLADASGHIESGVNITLKYNTLYINIHTRRRSIFKKITGWFGSS